MASNKETIKLYWVTTQDHDEDWFIFAESAKNARAYHEHYEGYGKGDASSRLIVSNVTLEKFMNGTPPCHAQFEDLFQIGFQDAGTIPNRRGVKFSGEIFREGSLRPSSNWDGSSRPLANGCLDLGETTSSTIEPEAAPGWKQACAWWAKSRNEAAPPGCGGLLGERRGRVKRACTRSGFRNSTSDGDLLSTSPAHRSPTPFQSAIELLSCR
jgi:hypothetical protein